MTCGSWRAASLAGPRPRLGCVDLGHLLAGRRQPDRAQFDGAAGVGSRARAARGSAPAAKSGGWLPGGWRRLDLELAPQTAEPAAEELADGGFALAERRGDLLMHHAGAVVQHGHLADGRGEP
jgi:hypothetical protein